MKIFDLNFINQFFNKKSRYNVTSYIPNDKRHSPFVIKGLVELHNSGFISLKFRSISFPVNNRVALIDNNFCDQKESYPWCIELEIYDNLLKRKIRVGIDLQDWENLFSKHSIDRCDIIYKRAISDKTQKILEGIKPNFFKAFGPNHNVYLKSYYYSFFFKKSKLKSNFKTIINNPQKIFNFFSLYNFNKKFKRKFQNKVIYKIKNPPNYDYIFFQVKYYDWENKFSKHVNSRRARFIRSLKHFFGEKFVGGMYYEKALPPEFIDCQTDVSPEFNNYKNFVNNATIVISSNGFGDSIPWKLIEYMKWGCCIVSEKNKHHFRIEPDKDILEVFINESELILKCKNLLFDKKRISSFKLKSKIYYEKNLKPSAVLREIIENS